MQKRASLRVLNAKMLGMIADSCTFMKRKLFRPRVLGKSDLAAC